MTKTETVTETMRYLTFRMDGEKFAFKVDQAREVLDICKITKVPRSPDFMRGVINVRGSVIPVVDLRLKFGMGEIRNSVDTRIIVMEVAMGEETVTVGALADSVEEVVELDQADIEDPPRLGSGWRSEFISGVGKRNDGFIMIIDIDRVFSSGDMPILRLSEEITASGPESSDAA